MGLKSSGCPRLILSARFPGRVRELGGDRGTGWIVLGKGWKKGYGFYGAGLAGKKRESRTKGRGTGQANRLSSQGLRSLGPGSLRRFFFLSSLIFFFLLSTRILHARPYPLAPFVPVTSIPRQCGILLRDFGHLPRTFARAKILRPTND